MISGCVGARTAGVPRITLLVLACLFARPGDARADWLLTPFIGLTFATETAFVQPDPGAAESNHMVFGGSGAWLSAGIFGVEADLAFAPGFFEQDAPFKLVLSSRVTTLFGNAIAALPLSVTRESLRPYVLAGVGLVHVHLQDAVRLVEPGNSLGLQLGGGAIGMVTDRVGLRFDLRHTRTMSRATTILAERETKLSFWRGTVGATLRF